MDSFLMCRCVGVGAAVGGCSARCVSFFTALLERSERVPTFGNPEKRQGRYFVRTDPPVVHGSRGLLCTTTLYIITHPHPPPPLSHLLSHRQFLCLRVFVWIVRIWLFHGPFIHDKAPQSLLHSFWDYLGSGWEGRLARVGQCSLSCLY